MKAESTIKPEELFTISVSGDIASVIFYDNIKEVPFENPNDSEEETCKKWEWDEYRLSVKNREGLQETIQQDLSIWLEMAKRQEYDDEAAKIREKRNKLLEESDPLMFIDRIKLEVPKEQTFKAWLPLLGEIVKYITNDWAEYRQALRDLPQQKGFPFDVTFPKKPE